MFIVTYFTGVQCSLTSIAGCMKHRLNKTVVPGSLTVRYGGNRAGLDDGMSRNCWVVKMLITPECLGKDN